MIKLSVLALFLIFFIKHTGICEEIFQTELESICLSNIQQLTYPEMGFDKAGEAYFSPDDSKIIFQASVLGERYYQMYVMDLTDRATIMVSTGIGACTCGFFRPDGKKIIFASSHSSPDPAKIDTPSDRYTWELTPYMNIYEANLDGSDLNALTYGPAYHAECAYSPDGTKIVYASNETGHMQLYTMNADGSDSKCITRIESCYHGGPFFSPSGNEIIFRCDRELPHYLQIYRINSDGSNEQQLTNDKAVNWAPFWHPNGKVIAYTTSLHGHQHYEIYLLNLETMIKYRVTHNSSFDGLPTFNHDGSKILWTSKRADNSCQIFMADFILPNEMK